MKTIRTITIASFLGLLGLGAHAQQIPMYTHYMYNTLSINPAYAGSREALSITLLNRSQWVGFKGAPLTQTLTLHAPIRNKHIGLGLSVSNDKIGPTNNTSIFASFAYIMQLNTKSKLSLGFSGGANILQANLNNLNLDQQDDPVFASNIRNHTTPNFGFGIYYSRERFYAGVSTPNLLQNSYSIVKLNDGSSLVAKEQRHYFFIAGTVLNINKNLAFKPTIFVKVTNAAPIQTDLTASFLIKQKFLLGAMYRTGDAAGILVGFDLTQQFHMGYSFDFSFGNRTARYNNGSHEIVLRYDFVFSSRKQINSPRYF